MKIPGPVPFKVSPELQCYQDGTDSGEDEIDDEFHNAPLSDTKTFPVEVTNQDHMK